MDRSSLSTMPSVLPFVGGWGDRLMGWFTLIVAVTGTVFFAAQLPTIAAGEVTRVAAPWVPSLELSLSFYLDGLSVMMGLLITGIGVIVTLYAGRYLAGHRHYGRFFLYLLLFMLSMIGVVTADNILLLFIFWELTTLTSFLLVGFENQKENARRNALQALLVTGAGGLALLAGLLLLASVGDSMEMSALRTHGDAMREHALFLPVLVLLLIGAFTKSAQFPFHFWLPNAMAAPTPVSAYLHSATMVKAGIYLLARIHPIFSGTPEWLWTLTIVGAVTAVWASLVALRQTDLKLALAYTTVMGLGTITMFLGSEQKIAIAAAMTFLLVHALYKCTLFLVVGNIDHGSGTREVDRLGGLASAMPVSAGIAAVAALSMAGFPPFLGFIGKELKYEGALAIASEPILVAGSAVIANALMVVLAGVIAIKPFYGPRGTLPHTPHEAHPWMLAGPVVLAGLGLMLGLLPPFASSMLVEPSVNAILIGEQTVTLKLWHGINVPLLLSVLTFVSGVVLYRRYGTIRQALAWVDARLPAQADNVYDRVFDSFVAFAGWQTRLVQPGSLSRYLLVIVGVIGFGTGIAFLAKGGLVVPDLWPRLLLHEWGVALLIVAGTVLCLLTGSRLAAICGLSAVGTGVALIFLIYGAPDVAMTQLFVEVLFIVIIAVVFLRLPAYYGPTDVENGKRWPDVLIATVAGATVSAVTFAVLATPFDRSLSDYFAATSVPEAYGRNIVNVILVDFRALDTLGEIAVVAIAGLAIHALARRQRPSATEKTKR